MKSPYPIFFPVVPPVFSDEQSRWWWHQADLGSMDVGPFITRGQAVASWAEAMLLVEFDRESKALDLALGMSILQAPMPSSRQGIIDCKLNELCLNVELDQSGYIGLTEQALAVAESLQELAVEVSCQPALLAAGALSAELRGNLLLAGGGRP